jgi:hypothetical protein
VFDLVTWHVYALGKPTLSYANPAANRASVTVNGTPQAAYTYGDGTLVSAVANGVTSSHTQDVAGGLSQCWPRPAASPQQHPSPPSTEQAPSGGEGCAAGRS